MKFSSPTILILSLVLGAGAGVVASSWTLSSLQDYSSIISTKGSISLSGERPKVEPDNYERALQEVKEKAATAAVEIFAKPSDATGAYEPGQGSGSGFFITSDGWLLTAPYFLNKVEAGQAVVVVNSKIYPVQKVVQESASAIMFLKIDITNAPVAPFGNTLLVEPGDQVFVLTSPEEILATSIFRSVFDGPISAPAENVDRRFELAWPVSAYLAGSAVVNTSGEIIGLVVAKEFDKTATVLPFTGVKTAIYSLLKEENILPLWFGAIVTDLSRAIGYDEVYTHGYTHGALVGTITKESPAATAGLLRGDIILSVDGLEILARQSLSELLSEYRPGDSIELVIDRGGTISKIILTLATP